MLLIVDAEAAALHHAAIVGAHVFVYRTRAFVYLASLEKKKVEEGSLDEVDVFVVS